MIARLIRWSVANRFLVLLATAFLTAWGIFGLRATPIDALPDLSDVQDHQGSVGIGKSGVGSCRPGIQADGLIEIVDGLGDRACRALA